MVGHCGYYIFECGRLGGQMRERGGAESITYPVLAVAVAVINYTVQQTQHLNAVTFHLMENEAFPTASLGVCRKRVGTVARVTRSVHVGWSMWFG